MAFDLDPGPPAGLAECCEVAAAPARDARRASASSASRRPRARRASRSTRRSTAARRPTTRRSRSRRRSPATWRREHPKLIVSTQKKELRKGKVLIDWSQNDEHKTTVSVYSLRARERPTVSTPVRWEELDDPGGARLRVRRGARAGRARTATCSRRCWRCSRSSRSCSVRHDGRLVARPAGGAPVRGRRRAAGAYDVDLAALCAELEGPVARVHAASSWPSRCPRPSS